MMVRDNERFQKHVLIIKEAIDSLPTHQQRVGRELLSDMIQGAIDLDSVLDPYSKEIAPMAGAVILKRELFHSKCRNMGEWLRANCPAVELI